MSADPVVIGVDFGTLSGRALVVRVADGRELGSAVSAYEHGIITATLPGSGAPLGVDWALQSPEDWRNVLREAVPRALAASGRSADDVVGIATDFTACTVLPTTADGVPLCELEPFSERPHAWPKLWRHHAAQSQADRINRQAVDRRESWIERYGGRISSEWEFAKALQVLEDDPEVFNAMNHWVEAADWIVWQLCGHLRRNVCTAGYKGQHQDGRWPSEEFCAALHPAFAGFARDKLEGPLWQLGARAGELTPTAASWCGLHAGTAVAVGNVDAHVTAAAAQSLEPGNMVATMGTSTCHVVTDRSLTPVPGICGVVKDGIVAGLWGYEAGQSGVGDIFAWVVQNCVSSSYEREAAERSMSLHDLLTEKAARQNVGEHGLLALDWLSGNRTVLVDHDLSGVIVGLRLSTTPEDIYRAMIEATAFGTRVIIDAFESSGITIERFCAAGGLVNNPFVMQIYADVMGRPVDLIASSEGPALGSAIHAAVAAGCYPDVCAASLAMGRRRPEPVVPDPVRRAAYERLYLMYVELHDHFGRTGVSLVHELQEIRVATICHQPRREGTP